jgi:hypothetical protein
MYFSVHRKGGQKKGTEKGTDIHKFNHKICWFKTNDYGDILEQETT